MSTGGGKRSRDGSLDIGHLIEAFRVRELWNREYLEGRMTLPLDIWSCDVYLAHSLDFPTSTQIIISLAVSPPNPARMRASFLAGSSVPTLLKKRFSTLRRS
ncbi:hypothetical protein RIF29_10246 [Crotalaria pallida]|uniref:Uncharacterized protein n=1 Tax=Crotalaria pallida TaxID=3830 RepID=A0AAN9IKR2_CROPI